LSKMSLVHWRHSFGQEVCENINVGNSKLRSISAPMSHDKLASGN
jgi:hypothetical protein